MLQGNGGALQYEQIKPSKQSNVFWVCFPAQI